MTNHSRQIPAAKGGHVRNPSSMRINDDEKRTFDQTPRSVLKGPDAAGSTISVAVNQRLPGDASNPAGTLRSLSVRRASDAAKKNPSVAVSSARRMSYSSTPVGLRSLDRPRNKGVGSASKVQHVDCAPPAKRVCKALDAPAPKRPPPDLS